MDAPSPTIVWFRDDLRLSDNPALWAAAGRGRPIICLYIHEDKPARRRPLGGAARWWLHGALDALVTALADRGGRLTILHGHEAERLQALVAASRAAAVYWNRRYDEPDRAVDEELKSTLRQRGIEAKSFSANLLHEPWTVLNQAGAPFRVFTAFWKTACRLGDPATPLPVPAALRFHQLSEEATRLSLPLADLRLEPRSPDWAGGLRAEWQPGEAAAQARLSAFLAASLDGYAAHRDRPFPTATSLLSPHLRFGEISPQQIWHAVRAARLAGTANASDSDKFLAELGWREFSYHLLYHHPDLSRRNLQSRFDAMPWRTDPAGLRAWQRGRTGYPLVDAGMRQLWSSGWMHNRVRMVTASFLIKHLLVDWREGEAWFWDTLVDADPANNAASWQWVAGSGADAAPYFRIFNPVLQGEKFDPDGAYVKRWLPELAQLPAAVVHRPWTARAIELAEANVRLGMTYPYPIVEHGEARQRALAAWQSTETR